MIIKQTPYGTLYRNDNGTIVWLATTINNCFSVWENGNKDLTRRVFSVKVEAIEYVNCLVNGEA